jgi:hypothetical protein
MGDQTYTRIYLKVVRVGSNLAFAFDAPLPGKEDVRATLTSSHISCHQELEGRGSVCINHSGHQVWRMRSLSTHSFYPMGFFKPGNHHISDHATPGDFGAMEGDVVEIKVWINEEEVLNRAFHSLLWLYITNLDSMVLTEPWSALFRHRAIEIAQVWEATPPHLSEFFPIGD